MQKNGTITAITPDGSYAGSGGTIYTFQMGIQCADGAFCGQIGSKSQTYPMNIGENIIVEMTNTQHGVRFKKINPQYQQPTQQGQPAQQQQTYHPAPNNKDRLIVAQVVYKALAASTGVNEQLLTQHVDMIMRVGEGKIAPMPAPAQPPYDGSQSAPPDDDIPF